MILYVNGDSHAAAAEAVNHCAWAEDDGNLWGHGQGPHPDNDAVSFGRKLATTLGYDYFNHSQSGCSNARIVRTTREWIQQNLDKLDRTFMLIQWTTWEREEWFYENTWWQVNASGTDLVHPDLVERYKNFVVNVNWSRATVQAHKLIWEMHTELESLKIPHLFFSGNSHFEQLHLVDNLTVPIIPESERKDWAKTYIEPYNKSFTYNQVLKNNGFEYVNPQSYHFGPDAHSFWAEYLLQYMRTHNLIDLNAIPTNRHQ